MIPPFEFATSGRILFGAGRLKELPGVLRPLGRRLLVICGKQRERCAPVLELLAGQSFESAAFDIEGEPTLEQVEEGAGLARDFRANAVIGFGGGSVMDAAKAIAALAPNRGPVLTYLEVIGAGQPLTMKPLPVVAVPTTAGTGAEVTRNAVLHSAQHEVKVSLRSPLMLPAVALVDPELTVSVPPSITANTGMDALTQLIEPFLSRRANPFSDAFCREGLPRVMASLETAFSDGTNLQARSEMALGSLLGGLALANSGLGAVHGLAAPLGGIFKVPHGAVCAALLPAVLRCNLARIQKNDGAAGFLERYRELSRLASNGAEGDPMFIVQWVSQLKSRLRTGGLYPLGVNPERIREVAAKAALASSMKGNPVELDTAELENVLKQAMD